MKTTDIRELSIEDIKAKLAEEKANYQKLKMNHKVASLDNPIVLRKTRRAIAQLATVLNEKETQQ